MLSAPRAGQHAQNQAPAHPLPQPLGRSAALQKDPEYGRLVREAAEAGVALLPVVCCLDEAAQVVRYKGTLPVGLDYKWRVDS